eukprot:TRINITY_DN6976_c0_g1_i3.p2 TRINITY_DN6976_c0_g1~~TRINITY_DN6976_c0_g1_i3.p2  ORF type:complete len:201 (+),score=25.66 TRINITY_DN6976_c0_g1_i3:352-954(+)
MRQQPLWGDLVIGNLIPSSTKLVGEDQPWSGVSVDICTPFAGRVKGVSLISAAGGPFRLQLLRSQGDNKPWVLVDQTANLVFSSEGLHEVSVDWVVEAGVCLGIAALGGFLPLQSSIGFGTKWYTGAGVVQNPGSSISLGTEASLSFAIELRLVPFQRPVTVESAQSSQKKHFFSGTFLPILKGFCSCPERMWRWRYPGV